MTSNRTSGNDGERLAPVIAFPGVALPDADTRGTTSNDGADHDRANHDATPVDRETQLERLRDHIAQVEAQEPEASATSATDAASVASSTRSVRPTFVDDIPTVPRAAEAEDEPDADAPAPLTPEEAIDEGVDRLTRALARSPKSSRECDALLREQTELDEAQRAEVLDRLRSYGYLDDERLAEQLVTGKLARKGLGRAGMARELRQRGLDSEVIDDALEADDTSEFDRALELANKRARSLRDLDPEVARRRLYGYLGRRGFSGSVVSQVVALGLESPKRSGPYFK